MRKLSWISAIAIGFLALFITWPKAPSEHNDRMSPEQELSMKQAILNRDVEMTAQLCRDACYLDIRKTLEASADDGHMLKQLKQLHQRNKHMVYLSWHPQNGSSSAEMTTEVGEIPEQIDSAIRPYINAARESAKHGAFYESKPVYADGDKEKYFVLSVPSHHGSIIGVVHQHILETISKEQRKNLRIVPYPSDKRYKIHSVDSNTLEDVKVEHPEHNEGTSHYHINEVVVKFREDPTDEQLQQMRSDVQSTSMKKLGYTYVFQSEEWTAEQMMDYFRTHWNPQYVEPHFLYLTNSRPLTLAQNEQRTAHIPNDVLFEPYQWNLPKIETIEGWDITRGTEGVQVAVIDTGIDLNHPDLQGKYLSGANFVYEDEEPDDDVGHGTHVTGVIAAVVDNIEGVAGMSWFNKVIPIKVLDESGAGNTYAVAQGIIWATDQGAKVINMSLGNYAEAQFLHDAIKYAFDRDVVLVAATGNDNTETPGYPAAYPEVFAVSATDEHNQKAVFSNYGDYVDVVAPGENIASTYYNQQYASLSGTSMASPHVAALAAMIRSANPDLTNVEVMQLMRNTAIDLGEPGKDKYYGYGLIDVKKALEGALDNEPSILLWPKRLERLLMQYE